MPALAHSVSLKSIAAVLGGGRFSPLALFAASEPGGWYDPSDLTTLFQDAAGTTPVTAVEQPVGLVLDKSRGLTLGAELVTNGDFSNGTTGWTVSGQSSISGGQARIVSSDGTFQNISQSKTLSGPAWYELSVDIVSVTSGGISFAFTGAGINAALGSVAGTKKYRFYIPANTSSSLSFARTVGVTDLTIDNISVRELPGSHLSQSTSTARPVLSARVNLLTRTEDVSNSEWYKTNATAVNATTLQDTAAAGFHYINSGGTGTGNTSFVSGVSYIARVRLEKGTVGYGGIHIQDGTARGCSIDLTTGQLGTPYGGASASVVADGSGWIITITATAGATTSTGHVAIYMSTSNSLASYTGTGSGTISVSKIDLRPANAGVGLPAYQRVGAATSGTSSAAGNSDYDTTGFPLYLKFDGTDDFLVSGTINPGSVDKAQVFAGVRKLSDAAIGIVAELSASHVSNAGTFSLLPSSNTLGGLGDRFAFPSRGSAAAATSQLSYSASTPAPTTQVWTATGDISGDLTTVRLNGTAGAANGTGDQGTGNYGSYPLYVGRRGGTSFPFNGHLYSLILRFSATTLDGATIASTETWVNNRTKAY